MFEMLWLLIGNLVRYWLWFEFVLV